MKRSVKGDVTKPWSTAEKANGGPGKSISFISTHRAKGKGVRMVPEA